jgi:hypothetical protein
MTKTNVGVTESETKNLIKAVKKHSHNMEYLLELETENTNCEHQIVETDQLVELSQYQHRLLKSFSRYFGRLCLKNWKYIDEIDIEFKSIQEAFEAYAEMNGFDCFYVKESKLYVYLSFYFEKNHKEVEKYSSKIYENFLLNDDLSKYSNGQLTFENFILNELRDIYKKNLYYFEKNFFINSKKTKTKVTDRKKLMSFVFDAIELNNFSLKNILIEKNKKIPRNKFVTNLLRCIEKGVREDSHCWLQEAYIARCVFDIEDILIDPDFYS